MSQHAHLKKQRAYLRILDLKFEKCRFFGCGELAFIGCMKCSESFCALDYDLHKHYQDCKP